MSRILSELRDTIYESSEYSFHKEEFSCIKVTLYGDGGSTKVRFAKKITIMAILTFVFCFQVGLVSWKQHVGSSTCPV